jgi:poly(3-hydroxyalkanoate) synthetase
LDDEFIQYCKLNNIEDIEKLAREVFNQGFAILKYGKEPLVQNVLWAETKKVGTNPSNSTGLKPDDSTVIDTPIVVVPKIIKKQIEQKEIQNMKKKADLYDE